MKKIFFALSLLIAALCLAACSEPCVTCVDGDGDGYCDNCYNTMPEDDDTQGGNGDQGGNETPDGGNDQGGNETPDGGNDQGSNETPDSGNDQGGNTPGGSDTPSGSQISFTISASKDVIAAGEGEIVFSAISETPISVIYKINGEAIEGNTFTPTFPGTYTVSASSGGKDSNNLLTLTVLKSNDDLAREINAAFSGAGLIAVGTELDIGLTEETASYYSIKGCDGYVKINGSGKLEFIGWKRSGASYIIADRNGKTVAAGIYNMSSSSVLSVVARALYNMEAISDTNADVSNEKFELLRELNVLGATVTDSSEFNCLKYLTSLEDLNIFGSPLGDLSFLRGLPVKTLNIAMPRSFEASEGGESVYNVIDSIPNLEKLTMYGMVGCLSKETYNRFVSKVVADELDVMMSYGAWMTDAASAADFSKTVFFSIDEVRAQANGDVAFIKPAGDFKHIILVLGEADAKKFIALSTSSASNVDLYGAGATYYTPIYHMGQNELAVNLYNYSIDAYGMDKWGNAAILSGNNTSICAREGDCRIKGSDSYPLSTGRTDPSIGIECLGNKLTVSADSDASLTVYGGYGKIGDAGVADGSNPSSTLSAKHGKDGGDGAVAIFCNAFYYAGGNVRAVGGDGNGGGAGGAGTKENLFDGGYNGGDGGDGGDGAVAISCTSNSSSNPRESVTAESGNVGLGGAGGAGVAAGKDGSAGTAGTKPSNPILIRTA
ncbi:MAG: hypothetical protein IJY18_05785 [Clostridia bacterium]|nr:hypothetical protein [Clostridia bacterium]